MRRLSTMLACIAIAGAAQAQEAQRIVSAGGDLTEIVYALGAEDRLVGVDSTSVYPPEATGKAQIGYVRAVSAEGILSLEPDLVIGAFDMAPVTAIDQIEAAGVPVELAEPSLTVEDVQAKVRFVGEQLGLQAEADALAMEIGDEMERVRAEVAGFGQRPSVLFILSLSQGAPMVGGEGSSAEAIIELAGGVNAASGFEGYKPMSSEAIMASAPDVVLMMDGRDEGHGGSDGVLSRPDLAASPAARDGRLVTMDGMLMLGFGPRTPQAVAELARKIHGDGAE